MTTMSAIVRNGQLELSQPIDLPDGTEVEIRLPGPAGSAEGRENEGAATAEEIARTLAALEKIEPFEMSDEERAALEADRLARKECEKTNFDAQGEKLRRIWE